MASTMQAWRTGTVSGGVELYTKIVSILNNFDWEDVDTSTSNQTDFYLNDINYIRVYLYNSQCNISVNSDIGSSGIISGLTTQLVTCYKSGSCGIMCFGTDSVNYSYKAGLVFDTCDNGTDRVMFVNLTATNSYYQLYDGNFRTESGTTAYKAYNHSGSYGKSLNSNSSTIQLAPFINSLDGEKCDNLYVVMITPVTDCFVDFNGQKWLITNTFALPAGDSEPEYTIVS